MLPQLSYIVAQAGVDSRPPPMLPRLTKPFQAIGIDSKVNASITTSSSTSGSKLDPSIFTASSYYVRPGSSPSPSAPPPPPPLPIPNNTSSTLTSPSTDVVSSSSYAYTLSTTSSATSSRLGVTPQWQSLQKSSPPPPMTAKSSSSAYLQPSSRYSHQSLYTPSSNLVYPTYQSNDQWTHRVTAPFVEPSKSSSSPSPPSNHTYPPTSNLPYTNSTQPPIHSSAEQYHQSHLLHQKKLTKYHQDHYHQQQRPSGGFKIPENKIALNDDDDEDAANNNAITTLSYGTNSSYTTSHRVEHINKWNQLLTRMDHEFWERTQEIYQEKLASLQQELKSLQNDTHVTFRESVSDLMIQRDAMIADAECFLNYEMEGTEQLYQEDIAAIEEDHNNERKQLHNAIMAAIEERKKLTREEKDHGMTTKDLFDEAYSRVTNKRTLRKRPAENSRQDSRKRQGRHTASHQLDNNTASKREEDELDDELALMKIPPQSL